MAKTVKLTIDGKEVKAAEGTKLIDAAESVGVHIPNLCYIKGMKGIGACRLCIVEVEGGRGPAIACNTKVKDGMVVRTQTDELNDSRKFIIDMILSMHPLDCMTCTKAGVCSLQKYSYDLEVKESSFTRKKFGYPTDEANPMIMRDPEYCILCGRCVRVCEEQDTNVLAFMGRGVGAKVTTENDRPLEESRCTFCGSCVDACPVNALLEHDRWRKGREWEYEKVDSVCTLCGGACDISVSTRDGIVQRVNSGTDEGSVASYLCAYGRFGYDCLESDARVTVPMKREKGKLVETTWDDALKIAAEKLKKAGKSAGFISNAGIQNEDALSLVKLAKDVVKTESYDSSMSLYATAEIMKASGSASLDGADLIVVVGLDTSQHKRVLPALDAAVRKASKRGAKLVVVNSGATGLDSSAAVKAGGKEAAALKAIAKACIDLGMKADKKTADAAKGAKADESHQKAAELMKEADSPVVLAVPALFDAAASLAQIKGTAVAVAPEANAKGAALMGLCSDKGKSYGEMSTSGGVKVLYAVGEQVMNKKPKADFIIVQHSHMSELAKLADLVLPQAGYLESAGTIVDTMGELKKMSAAAQAPDGVKAGRDVIADVAKAMGKSLKVTSADAKKLASKTTKPKAGAFEEAKGLEKSFEKVMEGVTGVLGSSAKILWLKEGVKEPRRSAEPQKNISK
jgi:NADH dehydrogenase/NADH:ubiquinone oxidoreductase subunit G